MVLTAHMQCPICGEAFGAWYSSEVRTLTCPFCMMAVDVSAQTHTPQPEHRAGGWLAALFDAVLRLPLLPHH